MTIWDEMSQEGDWNRMYKGTEGTPDSTGSGGSHGDYKSHIFQCISDIRDGKLWTDLMVHDIPGIDEERLGNGVSFPEAGHDPVFVPRVVFYPGLEV